MCTGGAPGRLRPPEAGDHPAEDGAGNAGMAVVHLALNKRCPIASGRRIRFRSEVTAARDAFTAPADTARSRPSDRAHSPPRPRATSAGPEWSTGT